MKSVSWRPWTLVSSAFGVTALVCALVASYLLTSPAFQDEAGPTMLIEALGAAGVALPVAVLGLVLAIVALFRDEGWVAVIGLVASLIALAPLGWVALVIVSTLAFVSEFM